MELRPFGIDVIVLAPGAVKSDLAEKAGSFSDIDKVKNWKTRNCFKLVHSLPIPIFPIIIFVPTICHIE